MNNLKTSFVSWFSDVVNSVSGFKDSFLSWGKSCLDSFVTWFENVKIWISTVNTSIWDSVKRVGDWIISFKNAFVEWLGKAVNNIVSFKDGVLSWFGGFFTWLWELFLGLFIPGYGSGAAPASSDGGGISNYFAGKNAELLAMLEGKVKYAELTNLFKTMQNAVSQTPENVTCELFGQTLTIIDWKPLLEVRSTIYFWIRGFYYPLFLIYQYNQVYKLIRGSSYVGNGKSGGEIPGQMSFDWGSKK